jgi:hypothetical protein
MHALYILHMGRLDQVHFPPPTDAQVRAASDRACSSSFIHKVRYHVASYCSVVHGGASRTC